MRTKNTVLIIGMFLVAMLNVSAEVQIDSVSIEPAHIEAGDEVDIHVKYHEAPTKRDVFTGKTKDTSGASILSQDLNTAYTARLVAVDELGKEHVRIFEAKRKVGHLFVGESWSSAFKAKISEAAPAADYRMEFQITPTDLDGEAIGTDRVYKFTVPVKGSAKFSVHASNILKLGGENAFEVKITNVGGGTARHVSATINVSDPLTIIGAGEAYLGTLNARGEDEASYRISVKSSATPGPVNVPLRIKYTDENGNEVMLEKTIGANIEGEPDIQVVLDGTELLKPGAKGTVTLDVINRGFVDAKFLSLKLSPAEGYTVESSSEVYIGNLDSDDSETEDYTIKIADNIGAGKIQLKASVEYKKENLDQVYNKDFTLELTVLSAADFAAASAQNGGQQQVTTYLLVIPAIIVGYLVLWVLFRIIGAITGLLDRFIFKRRTKG